MSKGSVRPVVGCGIGLLAVVTLLASLLTGWSSGKGMPWERPAIAQQATSTGPTLISAVSRKAHRTSDTTTEFDVPIPLDGQQAVEGRLNDDCSGDLKLVLAFSAPVRAADGTLDATEVLVTGGTFDHAEVAGAQLTLFIKVVDDPACVQVSLAGLVDDATGTQPLAWSGVLKIVALSGDVDGNGRVDATDLALAQSVYGQAVTANNFRADIDLNGSINEPGDGEWIRISAMYPRFRAYGCGPDAGRRRHRRRAGQLPVRPQPRSDRLG